jgi:L-seryl-tRNA(Ser) seleniumtransferase
LNNHMNKPKKDFQPQLAQIPSVEEILQQKELQTIIHRYSRKMITPLVRIVLEEERKNITHGSVPAPLSEIIPQCISFIEKEYQSFIRPVINGTGVLLHTNLGRSTLGSKLLKESLTILKGFSNLEYDLFQGTRGRRGDFVQRMLAVFSQSESALILNNNAAAVFLILKTLARGKEVVISRGELVQIGGGFRIPDILRESGAILREVGTTNHTDLKDYQEAINENTALLLKVHQSNFYLDGFTQAVDLKELKVLGKKNRIPVIVDLGSGTFLPTEPFDLTHEPMVQEMVRSGADIVCFSADKLLGGPQGGIICGKKEYLSRIRKDPLYRTFRVGKITLSLLQSVLLSYLQGNALQDLPVWQMISIPYPVIKRRCHYLARQLRQKGITATCQDGISVVGGGSLPGKTLQTRLLTIQSEGNIEALDQRLRLSNPAVLGRIKDDCLFLDPRTIEPQYDKQLVELICHAFPGKEEAR